MIWDECPLLRLFLSLHLGISHTGTLSQRAQHAMRRRLGVKTGGLHRNEAAQQLAAAEQRASASASCMLTFTFLLFTSLDTLTQAKRFEYTLFSYFPSLQAC